MGASTSKDQTIAGPYPGLTLHPSDSKRSFRLGRPSRKGKEREGTYGYAGYPPQSSEYSHGSRLTGYCEFIQTTSLTVNDR